MIVTGRQQTGMSSRFRRHLPTFTTPHYKIRPSCTFMILFRKRQKTVIRCVRVGRANGEIAA